MSPNCTEGLNEDQVAFLGALRNSSGTGQKQEVANQFEVTLGIAQTKAKVEPRVSSFP
jgi:hypothetical protein